MRPAATVVTVIDDFRVRVTRYDFAPGAETGWHVHGLDYLITTLTECHMLLETKGSDPVRATISAGTTYRRDAGVEHNVINDSEADMAFVEIELK